MAMVSRPQRERKGVVSAADMSQLCETWCIFWYHKVRKHERHSQPTALSNRVFCDYPPHERLEWKRFENLRIRIRKFPEPFHVKILYIGKYRECEAFEDRLDIFMADHDNPVTDDAVSFSHQYVATRIERQPQPDATDDEDDYVSLNISARAISAGDNVSGSNTPKSTAVQVSSSEAENSDSYSDEPPTKRKKINRKGKLQPSRQSSSAANTIQLEQHKFVNLLKNVNYSDTALIQTLSGDNGTAESDKCTQFQQSVLKQLAKLVESVELVSETKKQTRLQKKSVKSEKTQVRENVAEHILTDFTGAQFSVTDLPVTDASRFAICVAKKIFGIEYVASHVFEPITKTKVAQMASKAEVERLKEVIGMRYNAFNWEQVKLALNQAGRDLRKKQKNNQPPPPEEEK